MSDPTPGAVKAADILHKCFTSTAPGKDFTASECAAIIQREAVEPVEKARDKAVELLRDIGKGPRGCWCHGTTSTAKGHSFNCASVRAFLQELAL